MSTTLASKPRLGLLLIALLVALASGACGDDAASPTVDSRCAGGDVVEFAGELHCIYTDTATITETRFRCPPEAAFQHNFGDALVVCSEGEELPTGLPDHLEERGYLVPGSNNGNRNNNGVPLTNNNTVGTNNNTTSTNNSTTSTNNATTGTTGGGCGEPGESRMCDCAFGGQEWSVCDGETWSDCACEPPPTCEDGQTQPCACEGLQGEPGTATCEGETWGECVCLDPFTDLCTAPSLVEPLLDTHRDNTVRFEEACMEEVLVNGCVVKRTERTFDAAGKRSEERSMPNRAAFEQTFDWWYHQEEPHRTEWDYDAVGPDGPLQTFSRTDWGSDGVWNTNTEMEYNAAGDVTQVRFASGERFGDPGYETVRENTYDDLGRLVRSHYAYIPQGGGERRTSTTVTEWLGDDTERYTRSETTDDDGARVRLDEWTYNEVGDPTRHVSVDTLNQVRTEWTYRDDGTLEQIDIVDLDREGFINDLITVHHDAQGREIERVVDPGGNGFSYRYVTTYNDQGRIATLTWYDINDFQESLDTWTYRPDGTLASHVSRRGQVVSQTRIVTSLFDTNEAIVERTERRAQDDAIVSSIRHTRRDDGLILATAQDRDGDGEYEETYTYTYDVAGNLRTSEALSDDGQPQEWLFDYGCQIQ